MADTVALLYLPAFCMPATIPGSRERPPLGLLHIGAALGEAGFPVRLFDFQDPATRWEDVEACLAESRAPLVGMSCDSDNIFRVLRMSDRILACFPSARVVLGGPHATHADDPPVAPRRLIVRGDGELPMVLLARHFLHNEGRLEDVPGLLFERDGLMHATPAYVASVDVIDGLPCPDYSLLASPQTYWPMMTTSRGCPHNCHFCSEGNRNRGYRPRSVASIERELRTLGEVYGGDLGLMGFADDTFTSSPQRIRELCDLFDRLFPDKRRFRFFCEGRVDVLARNPELIGRLRDAGMARIQIGIEAGDQAGLDRLNKRIRLEDIERVVAACAAAGVPAIQGVFICGLPGQTEADVLHYIDFARRLVDAGGGCLETAMTALSPLPGTEFRTNAARWGLRILDGDFTGGALLEGCFAETEHLSRADIVRLTRLFNTTLDAYMLEKASRFPPERIQRLVALAADVRLSTWLIRRLAATPHVAALLDLRRRSGHQFLFEAGGDALDSAPLRLRQNTASGGGRTVVNVGSPFQFHLDPGELACYEHFNGKLTFRQIGRRLGDNGVEQCLRVYRKCEDKLSAIVMQ